MIDIGSTAIANEALIAAGITSEIQTLDEDSNTARVCKRLFVQTLDKFLAEHNWRFASVVSPLSQLAEGQEGSGAADFWKCVYKYPTDCVRLYAIHPNPKKQTSALDFDPSLDPIYQKADDFLVRENLSGRMRRARLTPFEVHASTGGRIICTNIPEAYGEYVTNSITANSYPPLFRLALVQDLASMLIVALAGGKEDVRSQLLQLAMRTKRMAIMADGGEAFTQLDVTPFAEMYR